VRHVGAVVPPKQDCGAFFCRYDTTVLRGHRVAGPRPVS
jgi:hypothetical protein